MARGWESKSVESQIESAELRRNQAHAVSLTPEQIQWKQEWDSLQMARTRILHDLETSKNPRYREILYRSLQHLDDKLADLVATKEAADQNPATGD
jgi:hypothetical protein